LLVGYLETPDFSRAIEQMALTDVNQRWQTEMAEFFEGAPGLRADEQMDPLPEVFHLT
jgi:L-rhamnose mutarotase